jgi:beta-N-acetylglucosaminidase
MKKLWNISLVIVILITTFIPPINVYALTCDSYKVSTVNNDNTITDLSCYATYDEAKTAMMAHSSTPSSVAVIYNSSGTIINAKYAIAKFIPDADDTIDSVNNNDDLVYLYTTPAATQSYTYIEPSYGTDAAFLDYDPTTNMAKVRISGYTGWTKLKNIVISPISNLTSAFIRITASQVNIRETNSTLSTDVGNAYKDDLYRYYEKVNDATDTNLVWYRIKYNGNDAWIANNKSIGWLREWVFPNTTLQTYYETYSSTGNFLHRYEHQISNSTSQSYNRLGPNPSFLSNGSIYYSFDGNYFYSNIINMLDDYKEGLSTRAVNSNSPYYSYYLYLPTRAKTGYAANDFDQAIKNNGFTKNIDPTIQYVKYDDVNENWYFDTQVSRTGISLMYGQGQDFVDAANTYGVNGLMMFGTALNESGKGTSLIAFLKKNLFGLGASDGDPVNDARSYSTVRESIFDYAKVIGSSSSSYTNPTKSYYFGSHYGNKGSGMNVYYASDPYWGEKQAANSYNNDLSYGLQDFESSTVGVTNKVDVPIYKDALSTSSIIYTLKNKNVSVKNVPLIVTNKIYTTENNVQVGWYKVYTDTALNDNQDMADVTYEFSKSYGYVKADDLYVANSQPVINANNISIKTGQSFNYFENVTASDAEDGNLTSQIQVSGSVDPYTLNVYYLTMFR